MRGKSVCAAALVLLLAGFTPAEDKKPEVKKPRPDAPAVPTGQIKKIDASKGLLILTVRKDGEAKEEEVKIGADTKIILFTRGGKKELTGKEGLESAQLRPGMTVVVKRDDEGKVLSVQAVGRARGKAPDLTTRPNAIVSCKVKDVDAEKGTITLTVRRAGQQAKDRTLKVSDETLFVHSVGGEQTKYTGKDGLKAKEFKPGTEVDFVSDDDTAKSITAGDVVTRAPTLKPVLGLTQVAGTVKDLDAEKGTLTLTAFGKERPVTFRIGEDTRFLPAGAKKAITGKKLLKSEHLKKGAAVMVRADNKGNVQEIRLAPLIQPVKPQDNNQPRPKIDNPAKKDKKDEQERPKIDKPAKPKIDKLDKIDKDE